MKYENEEILDSTKFSFYKETESLAVVDFRPFVKRRRPYPPRRKVKSGPRAGKYDIQKVVYHHSAGNESVDWSPDQQWMEFVKGIVNWHVWHEDGPKWRGPGYHILVPYSPLIHNGRHCPVLVNALAAKSWHTAGANNTGIGVCFQGSFDSGSNPTGLDPSDFQKEVAHLLWNEWLKPDFDLGDHSLTGHFQFGKPACPGDWLANLIHSYQCGYGYMVAE